MHMMGGLDERLGGVSIEGFLGALTTPIPNISSLRFLINSGVLGATPTTLLLFLRSQRCIWGDKVSDGQSGLRVCGLHSEVGPTRESGPPVWVDIISYESHLRWVCYGSKSKDNSGYQN